MSEINSAFGFVSFFYKSICYNFKLLDNTDSEKLRHCSKSIFESLKEGNRIQLTIINYLDANKTLVFKFEQKSNIKDSIFITSNYDFKNKRILDYGENLKKTWASLYYVINGKVINYNAPEEATFDENILVYANNLLFDKDTNNDVLIQKMLEKEIDENPIYSIILA